MSRFGSLEFGGESEKHSDQRPLLKDEAYYLAEANGAFASADFEKALRGFSKVLEFNPHNASAWAGQVRALIELGEFGEAKLWADKALERFPQEPELLAAKAVALGRVGDIQAALAFSDAAIGAQGDTPYLWLARGDVLLARREKRADYCFQKALTLAPGDWFTAWVAARIRFFYQQFSLALQLAKQALELNPGSGAAWLLLGCCQKETGLLKAARLSLLQAQQLACTSPDLSVALTELRCAGSWTRVWGWIRRLLPRP